MSVDPAEQCRRAIPVIERIRRQNADIAISIDTRNAAVAHAALEVGADVINDVSAGREDADLLPLVAAAAAGLLNRTVTS